MKLFDREPALTLAVVQTLLALLLAFGVDLTVEQVGAILAVTAAVLGWVTRSQVWSPASLDEIASAEAALGQVTLDDVDGDADGIS